ncbi:ABC transporter permease [Microbacterium sp. JB110]|uniref:ABC transporter permease n=1 Tax=Microbacterium sp. JB110 TaxID=2024477 RepID=UPI00097EC297|nr:ABC transporter permease [Microbacterium sp. JB110]RCS57241.1 ABC transporter permease [Microbacterium sp. JB110]SJM59081.1 Dipeptide transport system permease protein DppB (TC 3.A.1.5.2) [Frigoribacterium sp. JB110]
MSATATRPVRLPRLRQLRGRLSPRTDFAIRRLGRLIVSLVIVVLATFFLVHMVPGDPVRAALGPTAPAGLVESTRLALGLDQSVPQQLLSYIAGLLQGDLGTSIQSGLSVSDTIASRFPTTLTLAALGFVVAVVGALPIGMGAALIARTRRGRTINGGISGFLGVLIAIPDFVLAVGLISVFSMWLGLLPPAGWGDAPNAALPVLALSLGAMAYLARIVQVEMIKVLDSTYITTARAKRLPQRLILFRHALPNIVTATLTVGGLLLSALVAGTVIIETVFAIPGAGNTLVSAVGTKDYPMIQGMVLVYAAMVLAVNLVVDLILITIDPRTTIAEG